MPDPTAFGGQVGFLSVWLMGLSVGLTACTAVCLPFMGSWVVGRAEGASGGFRDAGLFVVGKVAAYTLLGGLAGAMGEWLLDVLEGETGHLVIGMSSLGAGLWLLGSRGGGRCSGRLPGAHLPPLALGFALSLTPCAPLAALLAAAALSGEIGLGLGYGACFGLGAAATPLLIVVPALGAFGRALGTGRPGLGLWVRRGAGVVLLVLGIRRLLFVV